MKQRNNWTMLLIILVALLLPACTVSKKTETETKEDSMKSEENVQLEMTGNDWDSMLSEEKLSSINLHLQNNPSEVSQKDIIIWLNDFFSISENGELTISEGVDLAIYYLELASKELTVVEQIKQFGGEGFTSEKRRVFQLNVAEEGDYVYVTYKKGELSACCWDVNYHDVYLSVAKNGVWITKDKKLTAYHEREDYFPETWILQTDKNTYPRYYYDQFNMYNGKKSIYYRYEIDHNDKESSFAYIKVTFDEKGNITSKLAETLERVPYNYVHDYVSSINTTKGKGLLLGDRGDNDNYYIILEDNQNLIEVADPHNLIYDSEYANRRDDKVSFADLENNKIYFGQSGVKKADIQTGEPLYNEDGKDKETKAHGSIIEDGGDGRIYIISFPHKYDDNPKTKIGLYDENLDPVSNELVLPTPLEYKGDENFHVTSTEGEIHLWQVKEYQRQLVLQLTKVQKIK
jgi:hypothetical protein